MSLISVLVVWSKIHILEILVVKVISFVVQILKETSLRISLSYLVSLYVNLSRQKIVIRKIIARKIFQVVDLVSNFCLATCSLCKNRSFQIRYLFKYPRVRRNSLRIHAVYLLSHAVYLLAKVSVVLLVSSRL